MEGSTPGGYSEYHIQTFVENLNNCSLCKNNQNPKPGTPAFKKFSALVTLQSKTSHAVKALDLNNKGTVISSNSVNEFSVEIKLTACSNLIIYLIRIL